MRRLGKASDPKPARPAAAGGKGGNRRPSGPEKAAILMLVLGADRAGRLLALMDDREIEAITRTMAGVGAIGTGQVEGLIREFADRLSAPGSLVGSPERMERFLRGTMTEDRVRRILDPLQIPAGRTIWEKLSGINEGVLANYLKAEYPQTVALVLSAISPVQAGRVLAVLPDDVAADVMLRMLHSGPVTKEAVAEVERALGKELAGNLLSGRSQDNCGKVAEIFNRLDPDTQTRFLAALGARDQEAAQRIKALMFTFDHLAGINARGIQALIRETRKPLLAMALKGANDSTRELFMANMSQRAAWMLQEDIEALGNVRQSKVWEAQAEVITLAQQLLRQGAIFMDATDEDEEVIL
ncbi:MAG: flagellar motor switch protein FliG [Proteobacteria bacterium]|nr:flagellar motor switch protein FliG [Pseudomonadota bacterium]